MRKFLLFADCHLEAEEPTDSAYELVKQIIKKEKFDGIICVGDLMDFSYISKWNEDQPGLVEGKRLRDDLRIFESELAYYKRYTKDVTFLSGNHEDRLIKYINKNPVLEGILSLKEICDEQGVHYVPTELQPYQFIDDLLVTHGLYFNEYFAAKLVQKGGSSIVQFHCHRTQSYSYRYPNGTVATGYGIGTLGSTNPQYSAGKRLTGATQSFGILRVGDSGTWQLDTIMIHNGTSCIIGEKSYSLT